MTDATPDGDSSGGASAAPPPLQLLRQAAQEARAFAQRHLAPAGAHSRVREHELLLGSGHRNVQQPALLLHLLLVVGAIVMRQQPLLDTCHEDVLELEALGAVDRRKLHCAARRRALALPLLVERVDVRHQADLVEESVELVHLALSRQAGQLAEVAPPTRLVVAALVQHRRVTTL
eukprot:CAMPEP_0185397116 /NCGR_PEP_ID=MMETSP1364-20130426/86075_1 /TAXON_ID=38817 /ORGANISM="Gephyrocapsa oceanica, Strain RCC1303" /LENGTH=175 /DNA_ID=CAMNT_0027999331 /DNA_START=131 /DNA_END=656 /DNA_ORIENTATION=+